MVDLIYQIRFLTVTDVPDCNVSREAMAEMVGMNKWNRKAFKRQQAWPCPSKLQNGIQQMSPGTLAW